MNLYLVHDREREWACYCFTKRYVEVRMCRLKRLYWTTSSRSMSM